MLPAPHPRAGAQGHRRVRDDRPRRTGPGRRLRWQGLPRAVGPAPRPRLPGRRPLPGARDRRRRGRLRLQPLVGRLHPGLRRRPRCPPAGGRPPHRPGLRRAHRCRRRPAGAVLGVRAVQAAPVQRRRPGGGLRRGRHRPQPGRRGRRAVRQRSPLEHRLPRPPTAGPARRPRVRPQGQAPGPVERARDGGLLRPEGDRLHRGGVPDGGRQPPPRLQGGAQRRRGAQPRGQARLLLRVPGQGVRAVPAPRRRRAGGGAPPLLLLRGAHHRGGLRLLLPGRPGDGPERLATVRLGPTRRGGRGRRSA